MPWAPRGELFGGSGSEPWLLAAAGVLPEISAGPPGWKAKDEQPVTASRQARPMDARSMAGLSMQMLGERCRRRVSCGGHLLLSSYDGCKSHNGYYGKSGLWDAG